MSSPLNTSAHTPLKAVHISLRSRLIIVLLRRLLRPWLSRVMRGPVERLAKAQLMVAGQPCRDSSGLSFAYRVIGHAPGAVPGHVVGTLSDPARAVILYLHGGAFVLPACPDQHGRLVAKLCRELDADGFLVDYRLAPANKFPAALDDCERAYRALLDLGFDATRIFLAGESAGGSLLFGLLQRIRRHDLPMPAAAVPISPGADVGRLHGLPARTSRARRDTLLDMPVLAHLADYYVGDHDASDPELSPLLADFAGFPPLLFIASDAEVLRDDTLLLAQRAREAGIDVTVDLWPTLPHAFPLLENLFREAAQARTDIIAFLQRHLSGR